jgi:hypothetical protein
MKVEKFMLPIVMSSQNEYEKYFQNAYATLLSFSLPKSSLGSQSWVGITSKKILEGGTNMRERITLSPIGRNEYEKIDKDAVNTK